jgi:periplasmic divalent cation tolerance protein
MGPPEAAAGQGGGSVRAVQVQFTIDDEAKADEIVSDLLRRRLIACAQTIGPVTSRYWWDGAIAQASERLIVAKTTADRAGAVVESIRARHPYDVPEIVVSEISGGLAEYLDWIASETRAGPDGADGSAR